MSTKSQTLDNIFPDEYENASAFRQTEWVDLDTVTLTLIANMMVALLCLFYFWSLRRHSPEYFSHKRRKLPGSTPPDLPVAGFFGWLRQLLAMREAEILEYAGFDAVILLRFYKLAFKVFAIFSVYGLAVIVPTNVQGGLRTSEHVQTTINTFNQLSMSNIQHYDSKMWVHAAGLWLLSAVTMYYLFVEYQFYTSLRHEYLRRKAAHLRTIVVEGVPSSMRTPSKLFAYFNTLYPNDVVCVHAPQDLKHLRRLLELREQTVARLERCLAHRRVRGEEQFHRLGMCGCGERVNSIEFYEAQLQQLNDAVRREQRRRHTHTHRPHARMQSISHVDMSYYDASRAGPIERSVTGINLDEVDNAGCDSAGGGNDSGGGNGGGSGENDGGNGGDSGHGSGHNSTGGIYGSGNGFGSGHKYGSVFEDTDSVDDAGSEAGEAVSPLRMSRAATGEHKSGMPAMENGRQSPLTGANRHDASEVGVTVPRRSFDMNDMDPINNVLRRAVQKVGETASSAAAAASRKRSWSGFTEGERTALLASAAATEPVHASRAFVTFKTFGAATVARQVLHCAIPGRMAAGMAPEPRDVYWPNIIVSRSQHTMRWLLTEVFLGTLMLFFPVLVTFISLLVSADNLIASSEVVKSLCARSTIFESAIELVQPLCLIGLMATLPALLRWVGHLEGIISEAANELSVLSRYFTFQVINVFLVTTIAGSALDVLTRIINHPSDTLTLLGETLPKVCGFFCNYVIIRTFTGLSLELVRVSSLVPACLRVLTFRNLTRRDRNTDFCGLRAYGDPHCFYYGQVFAQDLLVVMLVMTYACIAPIILVAGLMFFGYAQIVYRHQLLYVYVPLYESGGSFFPKVFRRLIFAMFTAQATMAGMFLLKNGWHQVYAIFALMLLTFIFKMKMREMYEPVSFSLPLEIATALDLDGGGSNGGGGPPAPQRTDDYLQPELRAPAIMEPEEPDCDGLYGGIGGSVGDDVRLTASAVRSSLYPGLITAGKLNPV